MTGIVTHSQIESLEGRIAPAGLISVTFNNDALELTSDASAHTFAITALDATTILFSSTDGSTFTLDGGPAMDSLTLLLLKPIKSLSATLGGGADQLTVTGLNVAGDIAIDLGGGDNQVTFDTINVKGGLEVQGGATADGVGFIGGLSTVKKDLVLQLGEGTNIFNASAALLDIGGLLSYTGGAGADGISLNGAVKVKKNAEFKWGAGGNNFGATGLQITSLSVGKDLIFDSSASEAGETTAIGIGAYSFDVRGTLRVVDGAGVLNIASSLGLGLLARLGNVNVVTGSGDAELGFGSAEFLAKSVTIDASGSDDNGAGDADNDQVELMIGGVFGKFSSSFTYIGGAGDDDVSMQLLSALSTQNASNLKIDLGDGNNAFNALSYGSVVKNLSVTGGTGRDHVFFLSVGGAVSNIQIDNGGAPEVDSGDVPANTQIQLINSKVTGKINVTNGTGAGQGTLTMGFLNSQIGAVNYTSGLEKNALAIAGSFGGGVSNGFTVKKALEVTTGDGSDVITFQNVTSAKFVKGIKLTLGEGNNQVGGAMENTMVKSLTVSGGSGADNVNLVGTGSLGAVSLSLGAGANTAAFSGEAVPLAISSLTFNSTSAATETDSLTLARIQVLGKFDATFGADASNLKIDDTIIGGPFNADTGAGVDFVAIDTVDTNTGTTFLKPVNILLGAGNDTLTLGGEGASRQVITKSTFKADGGADTNTLVNDTDNVFAKDPVFENLTLL